MNIILKQDVELLGSKFDVVTVKDGYARNFLIPQGLAVAATASNLKVNDEVIRQQAHKAAKALAVSVRAASPAATDPSLAPLCRLRGGVAGNGETAEGGGDNPSKRPRLPQYSGARAAPAHTTAAARPAPVTNQPQTT